MRKKLHTKLLTRILLLCLTFSFATFAIFPDLRNEEQTAQMEESDMDEQESNEEKSNTEEDKEKIQNLICDLVILNPGQRESLFHPDHTFLIKQLYLPVISPPPDQV